MPSLDSAQRINAGVLFEQERTATLSEPEKPEVPIAAPQAPKPEQPLVRPLQTYQGDIESLVGEKQVSVVSIAAAEAQRRGLQPLDPQETAQTGRLWMRKALIILAGVLFFALASGIGFYIYTRLQPVPLSQQVLAPFIAVDDARTVVLQPADARKETMTAMVAAKGDVKLSLGLIARLQIARPGPAGDGALVEVSAPEFLQVLTPEVPLQLVRTLEPQMLLGVHSYDENQAFMILAADSYETAYAGMLAWETTLYNDLMPLFMRKPAVRAILRQVEPAPVISTTTASTSSPQAASTTPAATSTAATSSGALPAQQFFQGNFIDQIVQNRDARVMFNQDGDILLLWTFLDRSTIVIATNEATLREVISRISQASILSLPAAQ